MDCQAIISINGLFFIDFFGYTLSGIVSKKYSNIDCNLPIPLGKYMGGWKKTKLNVSHPAFNEPLVTIGIFSNYPEIYSDGIYFGERNTSPYKPGELKGALLTSFVRVSVAKILVEASILLPARHVFMTLDTYRQEEVQKALFQNYKDKLKNSPFNLNEEEAIIETQKYVSQPSRQNSPHMTGGAVDITIVEINDESSWDEYKSLTQNIKDSKYDRKQWKNICKIEMRRSQLLREKGKMLDMGVAFDQVAIDENGRDKTFLCYYEEKLLAEGFLSEKEELILSNRRLLYNVLSKVGFAFYPNEPWHADYGDKFWAQQTDKKAFYGHVELSRENIEHEEMRKKIYNAQVESLIQDFGDPIYSSQPELQAHRICPAYSPHI